MKRSLLIFYFLTCACLLWQTAAWAGQAPAAASDPDIPVSHRDRVYSAEQFSNTVSVTDPVDNRLLGVIRLGDPQPGNFSPLYKGQVLVHGMGFSPNHKTIAVVSIGSNSVTFIDAATNAVKHTTYVGRSPHEAFFTPDGKQVWFTLKDVGKTMVFDAQPPFAVLKSIDTGPITNHVNIVHNPNGTFAYVTVGGLNEVKVFRTDDFSQVAAIAVGKLPHGVWPSGDGSRVYVGLENADSIAAIDTASNKLIATSPIGQAPQAIAYVPNAVAEGDGTQGLQKLGVAGQAAHLSPGAVEGRQAAPSGDNAPTSVPLVDPGTIQVLQAAVTGLEPKQPYILALTHERGGEGSLEPLAAFMTNPAGSAIVNATGAIRQVVHGEGNIP